MPRLYLGFSKQKALNMRDGRKIPISTLLITSGNHGGSPNLSETFSYIASSPTKFRKSLPSLTSIFTKSSFLYPFKWQQFWRLRIPINALNTWYRLFHRKITTKYHLHHIMPDIFAPYCQTCKPSRCRRNGHLPIENN